MTSPSGRPSGGSHGRADPGPRQRRRRWGRVNVAVHPESSLSLFSGIGTLDLAVARVFPGCRTLAYVEGESYAAAVLAARMASGDLDDAPVWSDIRTFPGRALRDRVDLVVGGFPCQDLSLAGKR